MSTLSEVKQGSRVCARGHHVSLVAGTGRVGWKSRGRATNQRKRPYLVCLECLNSGVREWEHRDSDTPPPGERVR